MGMQPYLSVMLQQVVKLEDMSNVLHYLVAIFGYNMHRLMVQLQISN